MTSNAGPGLTGSSGRQGERETHVRTEAPDFVWRAARRRSIQRRLCSRSEGASRMAAQPRKSRLTRDGVCVVGADTAAPSDYFRIVPYRRMVRIQSQLFRICAEGE